MPLFLLSVALLLCARFVSGSEVRLLGGKHAYEGRVEVLHNEEWRAICDHGWNFKAAKVVCRMLGFPDALRYTKGSVISYIWQITLNEQFFIAGLFCNFVVWYKYCFERVCKQYTLSCAKRVNKWLCTWEIHRTNLFGKLYFWITAMQQEK